MYIRHLLTNYVYTIYARVNNSRELLIHVIEFVIIVHKIQQSHDVLDKTYNWLMHTI